MDATCKPQEATYGGTPTLRDVLWQHFGWELGLPHLQEYDLCLLDKAMMMLNPPEARVRVVEVDTFMESERSIVRGSVPLVNGNYSKRQKTIILKRKFDPSAEELEAVQAAPKEKPPSAEHLVPKSEDDCKAQVPEDAEGFVKHDAPKQTDVSIAVPAPAGIDSAADGGAGGGTEWQELPEIILFWARNRRRGGNLVVCPDTSMDRLIQAYLVCEVVEYSEAIKDGRLIPRREGALMGVELGESLPAEQDALDKLLGEYSFHDAAIGVVSLACSIYYFGIGNNHVNVLTLLAVAVVAGLNQEATWPWVFKHIMWCSTIQDPIVKVTQCRRVHHHQGQLSGQGFLAIGLAVFGVYLEVWPHEEGHTPLVFRILLNLLQGGMLAVLVINMVQAVEPMAAITGSYRGPGQDRLRPWARAYLEDKVFDTVWYLTLLVTLIWAGVIAAVVANMSYDRENLGWVIFIDCLLVLVASLLTINPGMALLGVWTFVWLIPTGLAFVCRSAFDTSSLLINRVSLGARRMAREAAAHCGDVTGLGRCSLRGSLQLLLQVLPLTPLLLVFVPLPLLYFSAGVLHLTLRFLLLLGDLIIYPVSPFRLYPLLSDYGSVTWKMGALDMDVENRSMRSLLKKRVAKLLETGSLGRLVKAGVIQNKPYTHLNIANVRVPRLGCVAVVMGTDEQGERMLKAGPVNTKITARVNSHSSASQEAGTTAKNSNVDAGAFC